MGKAKKIAILLFIFFICFSDIHSKMLKTENDILEWKRLQYTKVTDLIDTYPNDFLGIGISSGKNRSQVLIDANDLALGALVDSINDRLISINDYLSENDTYQSFNGVVDLKEAIKKRQLSVNIKKVSYKVLEVKKYKQQLYISVLARKNRHSFIKELPDLLLRNFDVNINVSKYFLKFDDKWGKTASKVESKWRIFKPSTEKIWVEYDKNSFNTKNEVNFDKGYVEISAVFPEDKNKNSSIAKSLIKEQIKTIKNNNLLDGLIAWDTGLETLITQLDIITACNNENFKKFFLTIQIFLNSSDF